jgi:hypothetical protein
MNILDLYNRTMAPIHCEWPDRSPGDHGAPGRSRVCTEERGVRVGRWLNGPGRSGGVLTALDSPLKGRTPALGALRWQPYGS